MIAAVFLMQSLGQLAAYALGLGILRGISSRLGLSPDETDFNIASPVIDVIWRTTIGIGAVPALVSLFLRRIIPETPHYLVEKGELASAGVGEHQLILSGETGGLQQVSCDDGAPRVDVDIQ